MSKKRRWPSHFRQIYMPQSCLYRLKCMVKICVGEGYSVRPLNKKHPQCIEIIVTSYAVARTAAH